MNLILLDPAEIDAGRAVVDGRRARHLLRVVGVSLGQRLPAGVVRGPRGLATVVATDDGAVELEVHLDEPSPPPPSMELVLAVPRPKGLSRILQAAASFGVRRVDLINAWRVDKSYLASSRLRPDRLAADLRLGCEQGGVTWIPDVAVHPRFTPFATGPLAERLRADGVVGAVARVGAERHLEDAGVAMAARVIAAVGPDGGWSAREVDTLAAVGMSPISLGATTLRTASAVVALLAQASLLRRSTP